MILRLQVCTFHTDHFLL